MEVDELNEPRYRGRSHRGHYEAWYVTVALPDQGQAFWLRYVIESPLEGAGNAHCSLWAFSFDRNDPAAGLSLHDRYPIARYANKSTDEKGFRIEVGPGVLERGKAKGKVGAGASSIEWDLKFEPRGPSLEHVSPLLYSLGITKASVNSAHLALEIDGTIKVAGKAVKLAKAPGEQSHTWGKKHAAAWAWAHCNAFAEDKDAVFEGVSARVSKLGMLLPPATPIYLRAFGQEHFLNGAFSIWSHDSDFELGKWELEAEGPDVLVQGVVEAPPERFVSVEYRDPDGRPVYCNNSCLASMKLEIYERRGARWELAKTLTSDGTTAFEIAGRERDGRVPRKLDLAQARAAE